MSETTRTPMSPLERVEADVIVVGVAQGDRPLRAVAGYVDWRLCGQLAKQVASGDFASRRRDSALIITTVGLATRQILVIGLGSRADLDERTWESLGHAAVDRCIGLCAQSIALGLVADGLSAAEPEGNCPIVAGVVRGAARAVRQSNTTVQITLLGVAATTLSRFQSIGPTRGWQGVELQIPPSIPAVQPAAPPPPL